MRKIKFANVKFDIVKRYFCTLRHYILEDLRHFLLRLFWIFPINDKRVVFISFYGKYYSDNSRAVSDVLKNIPEVECVWIVNDIRRKEKNVTFVPQKSIKSYYYLATAKVWVDNCRKESWVRKRKDQYYVQLYHACIPFKCVEKDAIRYCSKEYIKCAINDGKMADLMVSNSNWCTNMLKRAFWFGGEIIQCGTPRMDSLVNMSESDRYRIKQSLGIENKKTVLYAPTFRNSHALDVYDIDYEKLTEKLKELGGEEWTILLRLHFGMTKEAESIVNKSVINLTQYNNIYDLVGICDIFITDYSTTMFEAAIVEKPVFIYAPDIEEYLKERTTYFEFDMLPFAVSHNTQELIEDIYNLKMDAYKKKVSDFLNQLDIREDGNASTVVASKIKEIMR